MAKKYISTTITVAFYWGKKSEGCWWKWAPEGLQLGSHCGVSRKMIRNQTKAVKTCRQSVPQTTGHELRQLGDVWGVRMCAFCVFPRGLAQLSAVFWAYLVLLQRKFHISKFETHITLKLFPNMSIMLEQMYVLKTSVIQNWVYNIKR